MNLTWEKVMCIIMKMFNLIPEQIATYLQVNSSTISRIISGKTKKITLSHDSIYNNLFAPNKVPLKINEQDLFELMKEVIREVDVQEPMAYMCTNEYKNGDYKRFVMEMLRMADSNASSQKRKKLKSSPISLRKILPESSHCFIGRKDELEAIKEVLTNNSYVILTGMGGIGKSRTALEYAYRLEENGGWNIQHVICEYTDSIRDAVNRLEFDRLNDDNKKLNFEQKIELLKDLHSPTLLIFDNLNQKLDYKDFANLTRCNKNIKFLINSRNEMLIGDDDLHTVIIEPIDDSDTLLELYKSYRFRKLSKDEEETYITEYKEILLEIFKRVYNHTLTIELIAKLARSGEIKEDAINKKLRDGMSILDVSQNEVSVKLNDNHITNKVKEILKMIFDISKLNDNQKNILRYMTLVPSNGIEQKLFCKWTDYTINEISNLYTSSWIIMNEATFKIWLHPLISETLFDMEENKCFYKSLLNNHRERKRYRKTKKCKKYIKFKKLKNQKAYRGCNEIVGKLKDMRDHLEPSNPQWYDLDKTIAQIVSKVYFYYGIKPLKFSNGTLIFPTLKYEYQSVLLTINEYLEDYANSNESN